MECYWAYHDYKQLMKLMQEMYQFLLLRETMGDAYDHAGREMTSTGARKWPEVDYVRSF